jgi:predicted nucleic acid-binding protein
MKPLIVDASVVIALLVDGDARVAASVPLDAALAAPAHLDAEVLSALFGLARGGVLDEARLARAAADLVLAPIRRLALEPLVPDALSLRHNLSAYDALYVAAARALECGLVTRDHGLAAAPGLGVPVTVV